MFPIKIHQLGDIIRIFVEDANANEILNWELRMSWATPMNLACEKDEIEWKAAA